MDRQDYERLKENGAFEEDVFSKFGFYSVPDLTPEERKPPEFLINGLLPVGMTFLSGAPKTRKSFLALQMAVAVATGTEFFEHTVKQCDVAYLDLEGSKSRISARTENMSTPIPRNVMITNKVRSKFSDTLVEDIRLLHRQHPSFRLVIIDTYSRARGNPKLSNRNAYDADVAFLEPIQRMALEENIAVLFVHHDKKGALSSADAMERLSGTMGISGSADCVINLVPIGKRYEGRARLEFNPRDAKGGELSLVFDSHSLEWMAEDAPSLQDNPICRWICDNVPPKGHEGVFYTYTVAFRNAYGCDGIRPGDQIAETLKPYRDQLFSEYRIGIQLGCKSNGERGLRVINLQ